MCKGDVLIYSGVLLGHNKSKTLSYASKWMELDHCAEFNRLFVFISQKLRVETVGRGKQEG